MQKKKARKGFLFLRRESVLPPCRAGPVCPAGTNAVFCGGTHGSRPTDRCGKPSVGDGVLQWSAAEQMPLGYDVPPARRCIWADRAVRPCTPCHCEPVRAAKQVPLGYRLARQSVFPTLAPLDKPVGMGIIVDVRGRCDKRSAPSSVSDLIRLYSLQKPSLSGVAVFVFQLHNTNRNGIPPDVESKYPVHVCHPLSGL